MKPTSTTRPQQADYRPSYAPCPTCGASFMLARMTRRYCSTKCRVKAHRRGGAAPLAGAGAAAESSGNANIDGAMLGGRLALPDGIGAVAPWDCRLLLGLDAVSPQCEGCRLWLREVASRASGNANIDGTTPAAGATIDGDCWAGA